MIKNSINKIISIHNKSLLILIMPCFLAILTAIIYYTGTGYGFINMGVVNVICMTFVFVELSVGFRENINTKKEILFSGALLISIVTLSINIQNMFDGYGIPDPRALTSWGFVWILMLALSTISFTVVLLRIMKWSQEKWEEVKAMRQAARMHYKEQRAAMHTEKHENKIKVQNTKMQQRRDSNELKAKTKKEKQKFKAEIKWKKQELKAEIKWKKQELKNKNAIEKEKEKSKGNTGTFNIKSFIFALLIIGIFAVLFLVIPILAYILRNDIKDWADHLSNFFKKYNSETRKQYLNAIIYYFFSFVAASAFISLLFKIIYDAILERTGKKTKSDKKFDFIDTYKDPLSYLLVAGASLYAITSGDESILDVKSAWLTLFTVVLFILIVIVILEIVRIVLDQCADPDSLLKKTIRLTFVLVIDFAAGIILGIFNGLNIRKIVSSLLTSIFPEGKNNISDKVNKLLEKMYEQEIHEVSTYNSKKSNSPFSKFNTTRIWGGR